MKKGTYNKYEQSYGGRENYFPCKLQKDKVGDCAIRAVAHATETDYMEVMREMFSLGLEMGRLPNDDLVVEKYLETKGFKKFSPLTHSGKKKYEVRYFPAEENKTYIVRVSRHVTCIKNNVVLDIWNCGESAAQSYYVRD